MFQVFRRQLEIAKVLKKSVCLHLRGCDSLMRQANAIMLVRFFMHNIFNSHL